MEKEHETMRKRMMSVLLCAALAVSLAAPAFAAYRDVPANHWAAEDIQYVTERGLFKGTGASTFGRSSPSWGQIQALCPLKTAIPLLMGSL